MKDSKKELILAVLLAIALFFLGKLSVAPLFKFFEPRIKGLEFQVIEASYKKIKTSLLVGLIFSLIPILTLLSWRLGNIILLSRRIAVALTIMGFIAIGTWIRHVEVRIYFTRLVNIINPSKEKALLYPLDPDFGYYMFAGLVIGFIVSYFLFRQKSSYNQVPRVVLNDDSEGKCRNHPLQ
jgi:hypothetical protein